MNNDVNLITQKEQHKHELSKTLLVISIVFGVIFLVALSVTSYSLFLKSRANSLTRDLNSAKTRMVTYSTTKQKLLTVSERLNSVRTITGRRSDLSERAALVINSIPDTFSIDSIKVENNMITVKLASGSLALFDDFLETELPAFVKDPGTKLKKIESSSFVRGGGYVLTLAYYF